MKAVLALVITSVIAVMAQPPGVPKATCRCSDRNIDLETPLNNTDSQSLCRFGAAWIECLQNCADYTVAPLEHALELSQCEGYYNGTSSVSTVLPSMLLVVPPMFLLIN